MNVEMLKFLVELSNNQVDAINTNDFFARYPDCDATDHDLKVLKNLGYIAILYANNRVNAIGVNKKAIDYFKK